MFLDTSLLWSIPYFYNIDFLRRRPLSKYKTVLILQKRREGGIHEFLSSMRTRATRS